jgi:ATP-dependent Lon protease
VKNVDDVLRLALVSPLKPIEWIEPAEVEKVAGATTEERGVVTH